MNSVTLKINAALSWRMMQVLIKVLATPTSPLHSCHAEALIAIASVVT